MKQGGTADISPLQFMDFFNLGGYMKKVYVNELKNYLEKEVSFSGFVDTIRDKKFLEIALVKFR